MAFVSNRVVTPRTGFSSKSSSPRGHQTSHSQTSHSSKSSFGYSRKQSNFQIGSLFKSLLALFQSEKFQSSSALGIVLALIGSWGYVVLCDMMYLLRGGQLGIFVLLSVVCIFVLVVYLLNESYQRSGLLHDHKDSLKLMLVTLIGLSGYTQSFYWTGIARFIPILVLGYVMMVYRQQDIRKVGVGLSAGVFLYLMLAWTMFASLNR